MHEAEGFRAEGSNGCLRASLRHLDEANSTDSVPAHSFDGVEKLAPGIRFLVGGPGFEPGASRSRTLGGLVHRGRFQGFGFISETQSAIYSGFQPPRSPKLLHELLHERGSLIAPLSGRKWCPENELLLCWRITVYPFERFTERAKT